MHVERWKEGLYMEYLIKPHNSISPMGNCSCTKNSGTVTNCTKNASCLGYMICVTPSGNKVSMG